MKQEKPIKSAIQAEKRLWHPAGFTGLSTTTQFFVNKDASAGQGFGKRADFEAPIGEFILPRDTLRAARRGEHWP